mmetsp:Transcript_8404/g.9378  ORF Transcript_8404/g.9378 Transcript_8404/m.9378 type:complete len:188 (+) Transcript_8404:31-594(+)
MQDKRGRMFCVVCESWVMRPEDFDPKKYHLANKHNAPEELVEMERKEVERRSKNEGKQDQVEPEIVQEEEHEQEKQEEQDEQDEDEELEELDSFFEQKRKQYINNVQSAKRQKLNSGNKKTRDTDQTARDPYAWVSDVADTLEHEIKEAQIRIQSGVPLQEATDLCRFIKEAAGALQSLLELKASTK